jgi:hypothetical protein
MRPRTDREGSPDLVDPEDAGLNIETLVVLSLRLFHRLFFRLIRSEPTGISHIDAAGETSGEDGTMWDMLSRVV